MDKGGEGCPGPTWGHRLVLDIHDENDINTRTVRLVWIRTADPDRITASVLKC